MLLWRVAGRPDRRFLAAAAGIAFAILLPVAGTLVLQGLEATVEPESGWIAYREDGQLIGQEVPARLALRLAEEDVPVAAFVTGPPIVAVDEAMGVSIAVPEGLRARVVTAQEVPPLVPPGTVLVHPDTMEGSAPHLLLMDRPYDVRGAIVAPARGADAFEAQSLQGLQDQTLLLVAASVPGVALVAMAFSDQEARRRARTAATLAALGRPRLARGLLALRVALVVAGGIVGATMLGYLLWRFGGGTFRPRDADPGGIALAIAVPGLLGGVAGIWWGMRRLGSGEERLRTPPAETDLPGLRLAWIPTPARPLALGTRLLPILAVAALLFAVDIGVPLAAAGVPAAVAGERGEWVVGAEAGLVLGGQTPAAPAAVMAHDPAIDAIVAEVLLATLLDGHPVVVRGGDVQALAQYHGLRLRGDLDGLVLGAGLARHTGLAVGDVVAVQGTQRPMVMHVPVTGTFTGPGLLVDEALLGGDLARALGSVPEGEATLIRMRPDTPAAREALSRGGTQIEVLDMRIGDAVAGQEVPVELDLVNLGPQAGTRSLPVRVNDLVVAAAVATVPGHAQATVSTSFIAPRGSFTVEVNPSAVVQPSAPELDLQAPVITFLPEAFSVRVQEGVEVELLLDGGVVDTATANATGAARLQPQEPGLHVVRAQGQHTRVHVAPQENHNITAFTVDTTWLIPERPPLGSTATWFAEVTNLGGRTGTQDVEFQRGDAIIGSRSARLLPGQSTVMQVPLLVTQPSLDLEVGNQRVEIQTAPPASAPRDSNARPAGSLQAEVADRILGDAQRALVGLGSIALAAILSVVYLATDRTLEGRRHVLRVLHGLGVQPAQIRYRAAWEAAALAGIVFVGAAVVAKLVFMALGAVGWPRPFAHALPDPISWLFVLQAGAAFAGAAALAAYMAAGRAVPTVARTLPVLLVLLLLPVASAQEQQAALAPAQTIADAVEPITQAAVTEARRDGTPDRAQAQADALLDFAQGLDTATVPSGSAAALHDLPGALVWAKDVALLAAAIPDDIGALERSHAGCTSSGHMATRSQAEAWMLEGRPADARIAAYEASLLELSGSAPDGIDARPLENAADALATLRQETAVPLQECLVEVGERLNITHAERFLDLRLVPGQSWPTGRFVVVAAMAGEVHASLQSSSLDLDGTITSTVHHQVPRDAALGNHTILASAGGLRAQAVLAVAEAPAMLRIEAPQRVAPGEAFEARAYLSSPATALLGGTVDWNGTLRPLVDGVSTQEFRAPASGQMRIRASHPGTHGLAASHDEVMVNVVQAGETGGQAGRGLRTSELDVPWQALLVAAGSVAVLVLAIKRLRRPRRIQQAPVPEAPAPTAIPNGFIAAMATFMQWLRHLRLAAPGTTVREAAHSEPALQAMVEPFEQARYARVAPPAELDQQAPSRLRRILQRLRGGP